MILYHITQNLRHDGVFIPRVPEFRSEFEDTIIPRVSTSATVEGCLTAIPMGGLNLDVLLVEVGNAFKVFRIDTKKLGIPTNAVVSPIDLYEGDLVRDALHTEEHWMTKAFEVPEEDTFIIEVDEFDWASADLIAPEIFKEGMEKYDGDYIEAFKARHGHDMMPVITKVVNLKCRVIEHTK